jgi:hypothetical protein
MESERTTAPGPSIAREPTKETTMGMTRRWTAEILLDEDDLGTTRAAVRLDTSEDAHLHGLATWQDPDPDAETAAEVGDDVAVAEALSQIAADLRRRAARRVSA